MGTFFAARENQYPGAQLQYIFFLYARFHLIPPNSMGDSSVEKLSSISTKKKCNFRIQSHGDIFRARENQYPGAQLQYIFFLYARCHLIPSNSMGDLARNRKCTKMLTDRRTDRRTDRPGSNSPPRPRYAAGGGLKKGLTSVTQNDFGEMIYR